MNKLIFKLTIRTAAFMLNVLLISVIFQSCSEVSEDAKKSDDIESVDNNNDDHVEAVITTDKEGNQVITTIETKADGSKVKSTVPATAAEIKRIKENGGFADDDKKFSAQEPTVVLPDFKKEEEETYDFHAYVKLNALLSTYVSASGNVNYASIKANKTELEDVLTEFESNVPEAGWSSAQKLTFWINAYNIYTIKLIVDNYPTTSITNITAKPWHKSFIKLDGKTYSLNQIENDIIRKQFNEPRIHFALNCASKSCPVLLNKAYLPATVYAQMTTQTKRFLNDTSKNTFGEKEVKISQLFDWYKEDFTKGGTTVFDFINKYRTEQLSNQKVSYQEYSWDLNK